MWVLDSINWPQICIKSKYNVGQGDLVQVHNKKVALIELKMADVFQKRKIVHVVQISAQLEHIQQRYCCFYWFLKNSLTSDKAS